MFESKVVEPAIGKELMRAILADREDIEKSFEGANPYIMLQDYKNFITDKTATKTLNNDKSTKQKDPLRAYVTISTEAKQIGAKILITFLNEVVKIEATEINCIRAVTINDSEEGALANKYTNARSNTNTDFNAFSDTHTSDIICPQWQFQQWS